MKIQIHTGHLRDSCSRPTTFNKLYSTFQEDSNRISLAYRHLQVAVRTCCKQQRVSFIGPLSEMLKSEGLLVEFCLAKLVEIQDVERQTGRAAVGKVMIEVLRHGNWPNNIEFLNTMPHSVDDVDLQPTVDTHHGYLQSINGILRGFLTGITTTFCTSFLIQKRRLRFCLLIVAMLVINFLVHIASWTMGLLVSGVRDNYLEFWPDVTAFLTAVIPEISRFSSKVVPSTLDQSSTQVGEGFQNIANGTLHMTQIIFEHDGPANTSWLLIEGRCGRSQYCTGIHCLIQGKIIPIVRRSRT
ncbi:hypothetical protein BKA64DRAFT_737667 [Cadophora sp. MPI-SDFR-AT-0126]|nr:hypothetical protein BKA64DRAFT_737667 [Leotiomycetes sp. MPI-SDFR-AT-0126]